jgi:N utilization substance protein B
MATESTSVPGLVGRRKRSRRRLVQALYQWQLAGHDLAVVEQQFLAEGRLDDKADVAYFRELLHGIPADLDELEAALKPWVQRPPQDLDPVERAILWIGAYELLRRPDIPWRVVINESVELAKSFGAEAGHRFINGVLDKLAQARRAQPSGSSDSAT